MGTQEGTREHPRGKEEGLGNPRGDPGTLCEGSGGHQGVAGGGRGACLTRKGRGLWGSRLRSTSSAATATPYQRWLMNPT